MATFLISVPLSGCHTTKVLRFRVGA